MEAEERIEMGKRVLTLRKAMRFSQEELAEKANTTKQSISMIENGKREIKAQTVIDLAQALEISTDYLLTGKYAEVDKLLLSEKLNSLDERQRRFLGDFIRIYEGMFDD